MTKQRIVSGLSIVFLCLSFAGCRCGLSEVRTSRAGAKELYMPPAAEGFSFAIFSDRAGGDIQEGTRVWRQAIEEANRMHPAFVCTVGDLIWGYNNREQWVQQAWDFAADTQLLDVPFYPVAGNHDIYWAHNEQQHPKEQHESDYEEHFGPLWYAFEYNNCWFIILFSDEGNHADGTKSFEDPALQKMSPEQFAWLQNTLQKTAKADHVFVFLHHPRWRGGAYGDDWSKIHQLLVDAGNVSACFAGHHHQPAYQQIDGIDYYTLSTTGGVIPQDSPMKQHLFYWVNVQADDYRVTGIPLDCVFEPKTFHEKAEVSP